MGTGPDGDRRATCVLAPPEGSRPFPSWTPERGRHSPETWPRDLIAQSQHQPEGAAGRPHGCPRPSTTEQPQGQRAQQRPRGHSGPRQARLVSRQQPRLTDSSPRTTQETGLGHLSRLGGEGGRGRASAWPQGLSSDSCEERGAQRTRSSCLHGPTLEVQLEGSPQEGGVPGSPSTL